MVLLEGNWPISTPGKMVEPFNAAVSGSNMGKLVIINKSLQNLKSNPILKNNAEIERITRGAQDMYTEGTQGVQNA